MVEDANRDEGRKCLAIAKQAAANGEIAKAEKFGRKALKMFRSPEVEAFLVGLASVPANGSAGTTTQQSAPKPGTGHSTPAGAHPYQASSNGQASNRGSTGAAGPSLPKRRTAASAHAPPEKPPIDENAGTPEQRATVKSILAAKDFYEILSLQKGAGDEDIRKSYRKLALKLHPDKNCAAHAEEAFKAVSKAFSCLSDPDKRAYYDRTGYENNAAASAAAAEQRTRGGGGGGGPQMYYTNDFDPDEIFNTFFGGLNPNARMFRTHFGQPQQRRQPQRPQQTGAAVEADPARAAMMTFLQFLPVLLLFFTFMSGSAAPTFQLVRDNNYFNQIMTERLNIPFYVKNKYEFEKGYPRGSRTRTRLMGQVESEYYDKLSTRCQQEKTAKHRLWTWGSRTEARDMKLPSCDEMDSINAKLRSQQKYYNS